MRTGEDERVSTPVSTTRPAWRNRAAFVKSRNASRSAGEHELRQTAVERAEAHAERIRRRNAARALRRLSREKIAELLRRGAVIAASGEERGALPSSLQLHTGERVGGAEV